MYQQLSERVGSCSLIWSHSLYCNNYFCVRFLSISDRITVTRDTPVSPDQSECQSAAKSVGSSWIVLQGHLFISSTLVSSFVSFFLSCQSAISFYLIYSDLLHASRLLPSDLLAVASSWAKLLIYKLHKTFDPINRYTNFTRFRYLGSNLILLCRCLLNLSVEVLFIFAEYIWLLAFISLLVLLSKEVAHLKGVRWNFARFLWNSLTLGPVGYSQIRHDGK